MQYIDRLDPTYFYNHNLGCGFDPVEKYVSVKLDHFPG